MEVLIRVEAERWCNEHAVALTGSRLPERPSTAPFSIPGDSGERVALVTSRMQRFRQAEQLLVWFDGWSVWPSGQRMHIFEKFRLGYGETRPLADAPAHIFRADELEDAISFTTLGVLFLWDCYVVTPRGSKLLFFSHDEWGAERAVDATPASFQPN